MRWQYLDLNVPQERRERTRIVDEIDAWWQQFAQAAGKISDLFSRQAEWDLPAWMEQHLQAIDHRLMWEFGPAVGGPGHRLVITPEAARHLRPLTATILERAPAIAGWEFYGHRLAEDLETALATVEGRAGVDCSDFAVAVRRGEHHRVDLTYCSPQVAGPDDQGAINAAFVASEALLGEELLDKWVGVIEVASTPGSGLLRSLFGRKEPGGPAPIPLARLKPTFGSIVGSIRDQLPERPHMDWVDQAEWTLWKLEPQEADDWPGQFDLCVSKSANPAMWTAAHAGDVFASQRFSRCGETFCYLKLDGSEGLEGGEFADKSEIEDAVDAVLLPARLGCHVGGGTGRRYSYVDLALTDVEASIQAIRQRLREGNVPRRSWIQFFDSELAAEWVGIYDDSPPPPLAENL